MRINTRLRLNTAIILGLLLLMTVALIWSARMSTIADTDAVLAGKMQKSASERVLVRDDYLLRYSEQGRIQWEAETEDFRGLLAQARAQLPAVDQPILDGIERDFTATVSLFHQIVEIKKTLVSTGAEGLSYAEGEQRLILQLLLSAYSLQDGVQQLRDTTQASAGGSHTLLEWLMFSIMVVVLITTLVNSTLIQRLLTRRIERLREGLQRIGAGHLDHRIPVAGNDELSDLARAGNSMAVQLMETTTSVENLQGEVAERKRAEERLRETLEELETTLHSIGDAVISTDLEGRVRQINPVAEQLTGWLEAEAQGRPLEEVFHIVQGETRTPAENPVQRVLREGLVVGLANHTLLIDRAGVEHPIADSGAPIHGEGDSTLGVVLVFRDQTRERAVEKELRESEERYRTMMEQAADAVFMHDETGRILDVNQKACDSLGYSREELLSKSIVDIDPEAIPTEKHELWSKVFAGEQFTFESHHVRKDGSIIPVEVTLGPVRLLSGSVVLGIARDITERKRAEKALLESETQYRSLIETMQDGVYKSSHEGKFLEVNPAMVKILGYDSKEELLAIDIKSQLYFAPQDRESAALDEKLSEMGVFRLRKKDGSEIWVEDHGRHVVDDAGTVLYHEGVLRDITERKRSEEALRESEERFRMLVENAPEPIFIQTEGHFAYLNRAALKEFGAESADRLIGTSVLDRFHPDYHAIVRERIQQLNQGREKVPLLEEVYLRMDGTPFAVEVNAVPVPFSYQGHLGVLVFFHSIEERKQLERETAKARTDFLYAVSHELKTPLFLMTAMMELIQSRPEGERQRQFLAQEETWIRNLARLRLLINNLVDSQRTTTLGTQIHRVPTDLAALVRQATQDLDVFSVKQSLTWQLELEPLPDLPLDPESIERMLHNLLTNAIKFSPRGGTVHVRLRAVPDQAVLEIEDHGKGISAEGLSDLFQPFARSSSAIKAVIPGTGLGLYVAKILVEAHGGTISLTSEEGVGTTVTVTLPLRA